jgi:RNA polymerase sigma-70 factor (ECF subfamily)
MTHLVLVDNRPAPLNVTASRLGPRVESRMLWPALVERRDRQPETTFEGELVALLPFLRRYANKLTRDWEQAMDLVQDACEKALRFRHLFQEGTSMRAWVQTIMRHHFFDMGSRRDTMAGGRSVPLEELSDWAYSAARAEQICFAKEVLQLAADGLSKEQASVFWPTLAGDTREECVALRGVPKGTVGTRLHRARSYLRRACAA